MACVVKVLVDKLQSSFGKLHAESWGGGSPERDVSSEEDYYDAHATQS